MEPTKQDAEAMLKDASGIQLAVRARSPREHVPFLAWGLLVAMISPVRDLGDNSVVGGILQWVALAVPAAILVTYLRRSRQVRVRETTPRWLGAALLAWHFATFIVLPRLLDDTVSYAYTAGGILAAVPILFWAERLRRRA